MPFVPVLNTALHEIRCDLMGEQVENTLWFEKATAPILSDLNDLNFAIANWWRDNLKPLVTDRLAVREFISTSMHDATSPQLSLAGSSVDHGANTPNAMPGGTAFVVSFRTALRGRSFRGRNYVMGLTEDQVDGNVLVAGVAIDFVAAYNALFAVVADIDWTWVVVSRFSGVGGTPRRPIPRAAGITTPVTSVIVVDENVDSQRRRLAGRGR